jgi:hypothetical protein
MSVDLYQQRLPAHPANLLSIDVRKCGMAMAVKTTVLRAGTQVHWLRGAPKQLLNQFCVWIIGEVILWNAKFRLYL